MTKGKAKESHYEAILAGEEQDEIFWLVWGSCLEQVCIHSGHKLNAGYALPNKSIIVC